MQEDIHEIVQKHYVESLKIPYLRPTEPAEETANEPVKSEPPKPEGKA